MKKITDEQLEGIERSFYEWKYNIEEKYKYLFFVDKLTKHNILPSVK